MKKSRIERIFRRIGAETKINDKVDFAVIYPLIDKSDFSDKIRQEVVCIDNEFFLISKDLGEFLGYVNTRNTIIAHVDKKDRKHCLINTSFGIQKWWL